MCGIVGVVTSAAAPVDDALVARALARMARRGPDAEGRWSEPGIALGHRRLAIVDLDARSHQPLHSACGRYAISYNGEIYNYRQLRHELAASGVALRTQSDTEVILALFAREGETMLPRLEGMFAFIIWDRERRRGFVARDPYGIKPLYYAEAPGGTMLASQVKAIRASGWPVADAPDTLGRAGFWLLGSVPEPYTWYRGIRALPAGHCAWLVDGRLEAPRPWQDIADAWRDAPPCRASDEAIAAQVREALQASVRRHLVADVPVGVFLSGGIDSGALAGLMLDAGATGLQGVTLAFGEFSGRREDETPMASLVASHYGIAHRVRVVTRAEFEADLPRILDAMDQPSIDGINSWYASKAIAEAGLKVVVSGVGGDELFCGYPQFTALPAAVRKWSRLAALPGAAALAAMVCAVQARRSGNARWRYAPAWMRTLPTAWLLRAGLFTPAELPALMGEELGREALAGFDPEAFVTRMTGPLAGDPALAICQLLSQTYLRNQLLRDSDWASMDHSVELRTPLVDARLLRDLVPVLEALPRFASKRLLAGAPRRALPAAVSERRKTGFLIPVQRWLADMGLGDGDLSMSRGWARHLARQVQAA